MIRKESARLTPFLLEKDANMKLELQSHIEQVEQICCMIEETKEYNEELMKYLPLLNQMIQMILTYAQDGQSTFDINEQFVLQVLKDIVDGIERKDSVFLLDVLRYGLIEIYCYCIECLQDG